MGFSYAVGMLSVVIETGDNSDALAATLASLVTGAVEGVVREVLVCDSGTSSRTEIVADHAGCAYLAQSRASQGIRQARSEWVLLLEPGARMADGWIEGLVPLHGVGKQAARFTCTRQSRPSLFERWRRGRRPLRDGLVVLRQEALATGREAADDIARLIRTRRLESEIFPAPR